MHEELTKFHSACEVWGFFQIRKNGDWVPIKPISGAFIINIGDMIEIISNGKYKSIEHRVVINPLKERMSIAAFQTPVLETIGPLPELVKVSGGKEKYKTLNYNEYKKFLNTVKLDGKKSIGIHDVGLE